MSKKQAVTYLSPKGELMYVFITGEGKQQMDKTKPNKYEAKLRFKDDDPLLIKLKKDIDAFWKANKPPKKAMKSNGIKKEYTRDEEGEKVFTGYSLIEYKSNVLFPDGKKKVIKVANAAGKTIQMGDRLIGNGSIGWISGAMDIYNVESGAGVTHYLNVVQLFDFVPYEGNYELASNEDAEGGWTGADLDEGNASDLPLAGQEDSGPAKMNLDEE